VASDPSFSRSAAPRPNMRIRPATPADVPAIIALSRQAESAAQWSEAAYQEIVAKEPDDSIPRRLILVIEDLMIEDPEIRGFLVAKAVAREWELENITIAASSRRQGLAIRLLTEFLDFIRRENAECVYLEVRQSNRAALALYKKLSFIEAGRRPSYYQHPQEDAILYKLSFK
jgi:ribosomal-protein-alanine N-acetyltransferase